MKDLSSLGPRKELSFEDLLDRAQEYMTKTYSDLMSGKSSQHKEEMQNRIRKYLDDTRYSVKRMEKEELVDRLYREMSLFGFLTPYLNLTIKDVEGIEIDSWDSVKIKKVGGVWERSAEHFLSPKHAYDIMQRILNESHIVMDESSPLARGHIGDRTRITVIGGKGGVLDGNVGVAASIRFVNPNNMTGRNLIDFGTLTSEMLDFLCGVYRRGISVAVSGETDAGKTTLISIILKETVPDDKKLITIEYGTREFNTIKHGEHGEILNSVIHLVTKGKITQQLLLEQAMTMNPDFLCMAEVKGSEAFETIEASLTGHPVICTIHTGCCEDIPDRFVQLASYQNSNLGDDTLYSLFVKAFPILVFAQKCDDGIRRIMEICECCLENNRPAFTTLWKFETASNQGEIKGRFRKVGIISKSLQERLKRNGMSDELLQKFLKLEGGSKDASFRTNSFSVVGGRDSDTSQTLSV